MLVFVTIAKSRLVVEQTCWLIDGITRVPYRQILSTTKTEDFYTFGMSPAVAEHYGLEPDPSGEDA